MVLLTLSFSLTLSFRNRNTFTVDAVPETRDEFERIRDPLLPMLLSLGGVRGGNIGKRRSGKGREGGGGVTGESMKVTTL